mgnify:CR=1 FL=1
MNKRGQWNIGLGGALIIGGIYLLTRGNTETIILGIIMIGLGIWLVLK